MNKKIVLGVFFVLLATGLVFGAFYLKNYMMLSGGSEKSQAVDVNNIESIFGSADEFYDYQNKKVDRSKVLPSDKNSVTIIHFWASWCEPCITEIPELLHFVTENSKNPANDYSKFIVVSLDESHDDLIRFLKNFPQLDQDPIVRIWDSSDNLSRKFSVDKLPATIFWYKNGEIKKVHGIVDWKAIQL